jgi:hypothetical protein
VLDPTTQTRNRQRRSRLRRKQGRVLLRVEVDEFRLVEAPQRAGRLTTTDGLQRARIEREAERVLADWIARWLPVAISKQAWQAALWAARSPLRSSRGDAGDKSGRRPRRYTEAGPMTSRISGKTDAPANSRCKSPSCTRSALICSYIRKVSTLPRRPTGRVWRRTLCSITWIKSRPCNSPDR